MRPAGYGRYPTTLLKTEPGREALRLQETGRLGEDIGASDPGRFAMLYSVKRDAIVLVFRNEKCKYGSESTLRALGDYGGMRC